MSKQTPLKLPVVPKKPFLTRLKTWFLSGLSDMWDWYWFNLNWLGKLLFNVLVLMPVISISLALIFDKKTNAVIELIHSIARLSVLILSIVGLLFIGYMLETPSRRRILYLMIIVGLWLAFGYAHFFGEDPDIQYRMMMMAVVGSVWMIVPLFLSMLRPTADYYDDDN